MHVVGRKSKILRYSLDNLASGCHRCHRFFTENRCSSLITSRWWGEGHMQLLREKARENLKTTKELRAEISKHYRSEYRKMEADSSYEPILELISGQAGWCAAGAAAEGDFVAQADIVGWGVSLNPAKQADKFTHDLMAMVPLDLKSIRTQWRE